MMPDPATVPASRGALRRWLPLALAVGADAAAAAARRPAAAEPAPNPRPPTGSTPAPNRPTSSIAFASVPTARRVERTTPIGELPNEMEGPHGLVISRDGKFLYMTTGHGRPDGKLWKYDARRERGHARRRRPLARLLPRVGRRHAGRALLDLGELQPARRHGAVHGVRRLHARPHRSRAHRHVHDAARQPRRSDGHAAVLDVHDGRPARRDRHREVRGGAAILGREGQGRAAAGRRRSARRPRDAGQAGAGEAGRRSGRSRLRRHEARDDAGDVLADLGAAVGRRRRRSSSRATRPTRFSKSIATTWTLARRLPTGRGVYNLAVTPDGKLLVATLKQGSMFEIFDLQSGKSLARLKTSTTLAHGVAVSAGFALRVRHERRRRIRARQSRRVRSAARSRSSATVDVGQQASGIAFWKQR